MTSVCVCVCGGGGGICVHCVWPLLYGKINRGIFSEFVGPMCVCGLFVGLGGVCGYVVCLWVCGVFELGHREISHKTQVPSSD